MVAALRGSGFVVFASFSITLGLWGADSRPSHTRIHQVNLPLHFELNQGQADPIVKFLARGPGMSVGLEESGAAAFWLGSAASGSPGSSVARMRLLGAKSPQPAAGLDRAPGVANYLRGPDPKKWRTGIPLFTKVRYTQVYEGVDLLYYGDQGRLEYDFEVDAGADPAKILLGFEGVSRLRVDAGDLVFLVGGRELRIQEPRAYQEVSGERKLVAARFEVLPEDRVRFALGAYDRRLPLLIDPVLVYSMSLGVGSAVAVDAAGYTYVTGSTNSYWFPIVEGASRADHGYDDVMVLKLDPSGSNIVYSTSIGGNSGDYATRLGIDAGGNVYVAGSTMSADFPIVNAIQSSISGPSQSDGFVLKLSPHGNSLIYSTYLGGKSSDFVTGLSVDSVSGIAYVAGYTQSTDFPVSEGAFQVATTGGSDGFVVKLAPDGQRLFATYLGGAGTDMVEEVTHDAKGSAYAAGWTTSPTFPTTESAFKWALSGSSDAFVAKFEPNGTSLVYSTFLGGSGADTAKAIAVDASGSAYVTGQWGSGDLPTTPDVLYPSRSAPSPQPFACKLNPTATGLDYCTYLGGSKPGQGDAIAVDTEGRAFIGGNTYSYDFPTVTPVQERHAWLTPTLLRSTDGGVHWEDLDGGRLAGETTPALSVDPVNPQVLIAGGRDISRSADGGSTWSYAGIDGFVSSVVRAPADPTRMYADVEGRIYRSSDGGLSWQMVYEFQYAGETTSSMAVSPTKSDTVYLCRSGTLYFSLDAGQTWINSRRGASEIVFDPQDPSIYYLLQGIFLFKETSGAPEIAASLARVRYPADLSDTGLYIDPSRPLLIDPIDTRVLYVRVWDTLLKSSDGGSNWSTLKIFDRPLLNIAMAPSNPMILYAITDNGVYRTEDGGATWTTRREGVDVYNVSELKVDSTNPDVLYAGMGNLRDAFVVILDPQARASLFSTLLGGSQEDLVRGMAVSATGQITVTGSTSSAEFPATPGTDGTDEKGSFLTRISIAAAPCTYQLRLAAPRASVITGTWNRLFLGEAGGLTNLEVLAPAGCSWQVDSDVPWLSIREPLLSVGPRSGTGSFSVFVPPNSGASREGVLTVMGQTATIRQAGLNCTYSLSTTFGLAGFAGGTLTVPLIAGANCGWGAEKWSAWITPIPDSGTGPDTITLNIQPNPSKVPRIGTVVIASLTFKVVQSGTSVQYSLNPPTVQLDHRGSTGTVDVTSVPAGVGWGILQVDVPQWVLYTQKTAGQLFYDVPRNTTKRPRTSRVMVGDVPFTLAQSARPSVAAVFNGGVWKVDFDGDGKEGAFETLLLGWPGATPVLGDWDYDGQITAGVYADGFWFLDIDGYNTGPGISVDKVYGFGMAGAQPVVGDWNGDGKDKIGIYINGFWFLDVNGNGVWDGEPTDKMIVWGFAGSTPVIGDWNGDGRKKVGLFYNGLWYLDYNGDGVWDGGVVDKVYGFGMSGVEPMVGDWNGDGKEEVGIYIGGLWFLDMNGNGLWDGETTDRMTILGWAGTTPVVGDWNGDGKTKMGTFINGYWYLDYDGNGVWDGGSADKAYVFGQAGDTPVVGRW